MRAVNERLYPIVKAIYGPAPIVDVHTRMKVGLKELGLIRNADPRPPLLPVLPELYDAITTTLGAARRAGDIRPT
jgi:4-hydroxy-tetrahydrodipicolinate synthase